MLLALQAVKWKVICIIGDCAITGKTPLVANTTRAQLHRDSLYQAPHRGREQRTLVARIHAGCLPRYQTVMPWSVFSHIMYVSCSLPMTSIRWTTPLDLGLCSGSELVIRHNYTVLL